MRIAWRGWRDGSAWERWYERFGYYRGPRPAARPVWVHAVSVGEVMAALPLLRALWAERPDLAVVITTTTTTGAATVQRTLGESVTHVYFPYDLPWILRRFLQRFRPAVLIVLETELWPNLMHECRRRTVRVVLVNGRLSAASARGYAVFGPLTRRLLESFDGIAVQGARDAERFRALGAPAARMCMTGSLKFDLVPAASLREQAEVARRTLGVNRPVLMFGSTREGEEVLLLTAVMQLLEDFPTLLVLLAPRHPDRFDEVAALCRERGHDVVRYSSGVECGARTRIFLVDAMGELPRFYAAADVAFVGGSLLPFGGHNVLEPAALGVPVVVGPHTFNFTEICHLLDLAGALEVAPDIEALVRITRRWLGDSNERDRVGQRGRETVAQHRGATARTLEMVRRFLPAPARLPETI